MSRIVKNPDERRRELLVTAMRLFAEEGYDNVSVRAVARAAGVAPGLAYHYFDSKQNMVRRRHRGVLAALRRGHHRDPRRPVPLARREARPSNRGRVRPRRVRLRRLLPRGGQRHAPRQALAGHVRGGAAPSPRGARARRAAQGRPPGRRGRARRPHGVRVHRARFGARHAGRGRRENRQALLRRPGRRVQVECEGRLENRPNSGWGFSCE